MVSYFMQEPKPRLTNFYELQDLVAELQEKGLEEINLYQRLTDIGVVDLDVLNDVIKRKRETEAKQVA